jgi:hypothetical protein
MGITLLVALGAVGQFGYYGGPYVYGSISPFAYGRGYYGYGPGYGYGYGFVPRPYYDPAGYYRYYSGTGYYTVPPTYVGTPRVITVPRPLMDRPGVTGRVVSIDEGSKTVTLRLPAETARFRYGPSTRWRSLDDSFPEVRPGAIVNVDRDVVTVLRRGDG